MDDSNELIAVFPDLALLKVQCHMVVLVKRNPSLPALIAGETAWDERLFLLACGLFAMHGRFFLFCGAAGFCLFLGGFLIDRLRRFIAHNVTFTLLIDLARGMSVSPKAG